MEIDCSFHLASVVYFAAQVANGGMDFYSSGMYEWNGIGTWGLGLGVK